MEDLADKLFTAVNQLKEARQNLADLRSSHNDYQAQIYEYSQQIEQFH
jgi:hypothetical protein